MKRVALATAAAVLCTAALLGGRLALRQAPLDRLERRGDDRVGSWRFPRGGPYVLGFQCAGRCELDVDGRPVVRGRGVKKRRLVFEAGTYAVRFRGDGRLLWHPPGRRGPPEYVAASSLSSRPPAEARFGDGAGASVGDGVVAALILVVWLAWLAWMLRRHIAFDRRAAPALAVLALALAVRLWGLGDAGQTWDEDVNWSAGRNYVTNVLELDFDQRSWIWNFEHPPVMKLFAGVGAQLADGYGPARAISALAMAIACALLVPIGRRLGLGRWAGLYAGLFAALSPHLVGHGQIVGHESFAGLWWTLAILVALGLEPDPPGRRLEAQLAAAGAVLGLAIFSRFASGLLGPLLYAVFVIRAAPRRRFEVAWKAAVILPLAALAVGFALWPRLWSHPVGHMIEAWNKLKKPHGAEPYLGTITNQPPLHYFAVYLVATAPLGLLLAAATGVWRLAVRRDASAAVLALWLVVPLGVMLSPVRQDGVRYIIPSLFALAMLGGIGADFLGRALARRWPPGRHGPAALLVLYLAITCARARPYYLDYYGEQVGGAAHVERARLFEIAWWGEGLAPAIDYLNRHAETGARVDKACVVPSHLAWMRADLWARETRRAEAAEWMVVYAPGQSRCRIPDDMELVFEERAMGAPLSRVYRRR